MVTGSLVARLHTKVQLSASNWFVSKTFRFWESRIIPVLLFPSKAQSGNFENWNSLIVINNMMTALGIETVWSF